VTIAPNTVRYRPIDQILDALVGILGGAKPMAQSHVTMRTAPAGQRACGRTGGAEPATLARPRRACTTDTVAQLARVSWYDRKRYGATPPHRCDARLLWVAVDVTPRPIGAQAAGSERPWRGRTRSKPGRKTLRITASTSRDILRETLLRGKATAVAALKMARQEVETHLGWTRAQRARIGLRMDGGCGTTAVLHGVLSRGSQVGATIRHAGRVRTLCPHLGPWQPTSSLGREVAVVFRPPRFWRATRQGVMRPPQETGGYHSAVLRTTVPELEPTAVADAYDGRAMLAATFCQDKQALGLGKRRQHTWEAPPLVLLFARLAPPLLLGSKPWLSRGPRTRWRLQGYGLVRWLQEVYTVPGGTRWRRGGLVSVRFDPLHPLATPLQQGLAALFGGRVHVRCWR